MSKHVKYQHEIHKARKSNEYRLTKRGRIAAVLAGTAAVGLVGVGLSKGMEAAANDQESIYNQHGLAESIESGDTPMPENAAFLTIEDGDTGFGIAVNVEPAGEDLRDTAGYIMDQAADANGILHPGSEVVIPLDGLQAGSYTLDESGKYPVMHIK